MSEHELWNELGNLYFLSGSPDQATHAYNKAIQLEGGYGKPYSNLALIYAKQAKHEEAIQLYKKSLEHLTEDKDKAITWNRLGNVYRYLKEYHEAVLAFQRADNLRSNFHENHERPNQMLYVSSESATRPYKVVEEHQDYQNHSADYMRDIEPEFDEELPELAAMDAEVLVNEIHYDQDTLENMTVENIAEPAPVLPVEAGEAPAPVEQEYESSTSPESMDITTKSQLEAETSVESNEQVFPEAHLIEEDIRTPDSSALPDGPQTTEDVESASEEITPTASEAGVRPEKESPELDVSLTDPAAQAEEDIEALSDELELTTPEADVRPEEEAPDVDSNGSEPVILAEDEFNPEEEHVSDSISSAPPTDTVQRETGNEDAQGEKREVGAEEEQLTKQIEINPRSAATWEALGTLYKSTGRYEEAVQAFEQAISIAPGTVSYYHDLGLVYSARGDNKDAYNTFQKVLELDPNHSLTHASLGGYYKKIGLDELAQKHIGKAMKHIYESENEYNRACLDAICGKTDEAIDLLRVALENEQTYVNWVLHDPDLDALREDERFKLLISEFSK
ncbi:MAG: tetratricopeptide repeat protein [Anaerolineae bacterium]|nr:tetratricopeptide repeat protein [Anaerolineae bacterium]